MGLIMLASSTWSVTIFVIDPINPLVFAGALATAMAASQAFQVPLRAQKRGSIVAILTLADRFVALALFAVILLTGLPSTVALMAGLIGGATTNASVSWLLTKRSCRTQGFWLYRANPWRRASGYGVTSLAISAQSLDLPIMSAVGGPAVAAVYGAVNRWTQPLGLFAAAFSLAAVPFVAESRSFGAAAVALRKGLALLLLGVLGCLVAAIFAEDIVSLLLGEQYEKASTVLTILAISTIAGIINQPLSTALQALHHEREVAIVLVISVVVQLTLVVLLVPEIAAIGAAIALLVGQYMIMIMLLLIVTRLGGTVEP